MTRFKTIKELSGAVTNHIEISYPTGIRQFDRHKVKFVPGQVVLVGSRPAMGRTMFLFYLYYNLWKSNHFPQCFITNEENENQAFARLACTVTGIELSSFHEKYAALCTPDDEILQSDQNFILSGQSSWEVIKSELTTQIGEKGIKAVYLDKIQGLISSTISHNREQELSYIIRDIKNFALEKQVIFFISSSLSRAVERREGKRPQLSDLRETGALEEFCDTVFLLHRPIMYGITDDENGNSLRNLAELNIAKNRFGITCDILFNFDSKIPAFGEFTGY